MYNNRVARFQNSKWGTKKRIMSAPSQKKKKKDNLFCNLMLVGRDVIGKLIITTAYCHN
jgi:hypothetical protein